jgi:hypothetical protein
MTAVIDLDSALIERRYRRCSLLPSFALFAVKALATFWGMFPSVETIPPKGNRDRRGFPAIKGGVFPSTSR